MRPLLYYFIIIIIIIVYLSREYVLFEDFNDESREEID